MSDFVGGGGGFGDPLERDPEKVWRDIRVGVTSRRIAEEIFGVVLTADGAVDAEATAGRREAIRAERLAQGAPLAGAMLQVDTFCPELDDENKPMRDFGLEG